MPWQVDKSPDYSPRNAVPSGFLTKGLYPDVEPGERRSVHRYASEVRLSECGVLRRTPRHETHDRVVNNPRACASGGSRVMGVVCGTAFSDVRLSFRLSLKRRARLQLPHPNGGGNITPASSGPSHKRLTSSLGRLHLRIHDEEEIGPKMIARIAKKTGSRPTMFSRPDEW